MPDHIKRITVETEADIPADVVKDVLETVMVKLGSCWSELTKGPVHDETGKHVANVSVRKVPIDLQMSRDVAELDEAVVVQARDEILKNLRDRRLIKYLFDATPEICGAYGRVEQPLDLDVQHEIAESMARIAIAADLASRPASAEPASDPCKLPAEPAGEEPVMVPRYATDEMMVAGLYHMPDGVEWADLFTAWHAMFDALAQDGSLTTQLPATPTNPERLVEALISRATPEWSCHEDNDRAPREFWHVRHNLGELSTDWMKWGRQEQAELSPEDQAAGEAASLDYLRRSLTALSAAPLREGEGE